MATIVSTLDIRQDQVVTRTWRVIDTDSFGGDYPDEFIAKDFRSELTAQKFADFMNDKGGPHARRFYQIVEHIVIEYKLEPGFEP